MERKELLKGYIGSVFAADTIANINVENIASALVLVEQKIYEARHPNITFNKVFPVKSFNDPLATSFTYFYVTGAGKAELQNGDGKISFVDGMVKSKQVPLFDGAVGYKYTNKELKRASAYNINLDEYKGKIAVRSALELAESICYDGDEGREILGFFNNPDIATISPIDGTPWSGKTPKQKLADIIHLFKTGWVQTKQVHLAENNPNNRLMLSTARYADLLEPLSDTNDKSVLTWIVENLPFITNAEHIIASPKLKEDEMRAYEFDEDKICFNWGHLPEFGIPTPDGLVFVVPAEYSIGGLVIREPLSVWAMEGI